MTNNASRIKGLVIASPGGVAGGGGMGSVSRGIQSWLRANRAEVPVEVLDTRGSGHAGLSPAFLLVAAMRVVGLRLGGANLMHVQVSERSSFIRKGVILRLGKALGMHTVLHHHGGEFSSLFPTTSPRMRRWIAATVLAADLNMVLSESMREFLVETIGAAPDRVAVLHNATNDLGYSYEPRRDPSPMRYALVANLAPRKGVSEFLQGLKLLIDKGHDVTATLAGGGAVSRYAAEATQLGIAPRCVFTGWLDRPGVEKVIREADALVLPSHFELVPMVILEAISTGLPVIATPVGAIPEIMTSGRNCILVPPGDVEALAAAMLKLKTEPGVATELSVQGRALYDQKFTMDAYMEKLLAIYEQVLSRPRIGA